MVNPCSAIATASVEQFFGVGSDSSVSSSASDLYIIYVGLINILICNIVTSTGFVIDFSSSSSFSSSSTSSSTSASTALFRVYFLLQVHLCGSLIYLLWLLLSSFCRYRISSQLNPLQIQPVNNITGVISLDFIVERTFSLYSRDSDVSSTLLSQNFNFSASDSPPMIV